MSNALSRGNILSYYLILQKGIERAIERERERETVSQSESRLLVCTVAAIPLSASTFQNS